MTSNLKRIPSTGPWITEKEVELVTDAARSGWYEKMGVYMDQFVVEFRAYTGREHVLPVCHGTAAIHLAMLALGVGPGDEVIVPDVTWVASACPVDYVGARIVFADIEPDTWCLCPKSFERNITKRTKAVVVVGLMGNMPAMREIIAIAKKHRIHVIEDAAESIGAEYDGHRAGTFGAASIFSCDAIKLVIGGQGGALVTDDRRLYVRASRFAHHGMIKPPKRFYWSTLMGHNYNWTNIQAAMVLGQLRRIDELVARKRAIFGWYRQRLGGIEGIQLNSEADNVTNTYWLVNAILSPRYRMRKEKVQAGLREYAIDARPFFYPISSMPPYRKHVGARNMRKANPVAYGISPWGISLPSAFNITEEQVDYVCDALKRVLKIAS